MVQKVVVRTFSWVHLFLPFTCCVLFTRKFFDIRILVVIKMTQYRLVVSAMGEDWSGQVKFFVYYMPQNVMSKTNIVYIMST